MSQQYPDNSGFMAPPSQTPPKAPARTGAVTLLAMVVLIFAILVILNETMLKIRHVAVVGNQRISWQEVVTAAGLDRQASQYFAVLTDLRSVGVMGDGRTYDRAVALRSVQTSDFMTADWTRIPYELLDRVSVRIVNEVRGVNRVLYDITSKPPATVEYE